MRLDPACVDMRPWASKEALMSRGSMQAESGLEGAHQCLVGAVVADLLQPLLEALGHCLALGMGAGEGKPETVGGDLAHLDHLPAQLLLLDEPTNHLDLASTQAIESALAAFPGAMLVVSHDEAFLQGLKLTHSLAWRETGWHFSLL